MEALATTSVVRGRLSIVRSAATGAAALTGVFLLCWIGAALGWSNVSHMFVSLFTDAPVASTTALAIGICGSIGFGAISGALIALVYNALGFLDR